MISTPLPSPGMIEGALCQTVYSLLTLSPLFSRPGHGGSLGGPRMQQQLLRSGGSSGVQASRLGLPGACPGSISGQSSREASPLLSGLEEVRRELEAMRAAESSSHDPARHLR